MTTAMSRELARKRPAQVVASDDPQRRIVNGHVVRGDAAARIVGLLALVLLAFLFAGYLLSAV